MKVMKYFKLFMLLLVACTFAACSDDDNNNTNGETTVSFASATLKLKESAGLVNIPIKVEGARNGDVSVVVKAEEVGESPAVEDKHYIITSKSVRVKADEETSATLNIETKIVDDDEINTDRTFKLTIVSANGAKIGENSSVLVTIRDNENAFYEQFFGTWEITGLAQSNGKAFNATIKITGEQDDDAPNYNNILTATSTNFVDFGADTDFEWHFRYTFDETTKTGTIGFICDEEVAAFDNAGNHYSFCWLGVEGQYLTSTDVTANWSLVNDKFPGEIVFPNNASIYLFSYFHNQPVEAISQIKMTKKK